MQDKTVLEICIFATNLFGFCTILLDDLNNYRPIGLETLVLKMLEGYLTLRLKSVIDTAVW